GGAIAGIGIGDFVRRSIGSFVEFERGLANISKTTDITGQALQDLGTQIIDMSKRVPVARDQLMSIAAAAGQLGVEGSANILKFTETVAKL
ncbi:phage tail tape measure protein, partial [Staphylococcus aureus]